MKEYARPNSCYSPLVTSLIITGYVKKYHCVTISMILPSLFPKTLTNASTIFLSESGKKNQHNHFTSINKSCQIYIKSIVYFIYSIFYNSLKSRCYPTSVSAKFQINQSRILFLFYLNYIYLGNIYLQFSIRL